jgi:alkanesulfonate monooxygenase SsuD/methylene tetrahydromethanopterin reductase-like flavin-dependent oxidoreductase (luciferase family)
VRLGLGPIDLTGDHAGDVRGLAEAAASSSFDCLWIAESRASGGGGALAAAAMAAQWTPIRVGAVVDVGLYHPLHLAEDIAVADITTAGRLEVMLRPAHEDPDVVKEHLHVLAAALSGAHIQWEGLHLRVPARLADNGPVPQRLALNPRPAQPAIPLWILDPQTQWVGIADQLGFGVAGSWHHGLTFGASRCRLPRAVLCPNLAEPADLLAAAGEHAGYFIVEARTPVEARAAGRRLAGPLRMPDFPAWVNAGR